MKPSAILGLLCLLVPSAIFLARHADVPQFGDRHDDSLYYVSAKSLAEGHYRIESLPGKPAQTKYPPLYPLLLSIAWRVNPDFPANLPIAAWLSWLALPILLFALARYFPRLGLAGWRMWLLLALLAANPYVILFSATLFSELWFTALLAVSLLFAERALEDHAHPAWAAAAGAIGGLAYLMRSAGIVLFGSAVLYFWWRGRRKHAIAFAAAMAPFILMWTIWSRAHQLHTLDPALIYYTDYLRYEFYTVHLSNLHLVLWKNFDGLLWGVGSLILPNVIDSVAIKILEEVLAVAMISGIVRMVRGKSPGAASHYALFAAGSAVLLVSWHFPPNERFVIPLAPLAFAGLLAEMEHFAGIVRKGLRNPKTSERAAAVVMASVVALVLAGSLALQAWVGGFYLEDSARAQRARNHERLSAYAWVRANVPPGATVIAHDDPVLFLYTGHPAISRPMPPEYWYEDDHAKAVDLYRTIAPYAVQHGAHFLYYTNEDMHRDMSDKDASDIDAAVRGNPELSPVWTHGAGTIYEVEGRRSTAYTSAPASTITKPGQVVAGR